MYKQILVLYDIKSDRKRTKFYNNLKSLGLVSLQYSVFWGYATSVEIKTIREYSKCFDRATDKLIIQTTTVGRGCDDYSFGYENFPFDSFHPDKSLVI